MSKITTDDCIKAIEKMAAVEITDIVADYRPNWTRESEKENNENFIIREFNGGKSAPFLRAKVTEIVSASGNTLDVKLGVKSPWRIPQHHHDVMKAIEGDNNNPWERDDVLALLKIVPYEMVYYIEDFDSMDDDAFPISVFPIDDDAFNRKGFDIHICHLFAYILPKNSNGGVPEMEAENTFSIVGKSLDELITELNDLGFNFGGFQDDNHPDANKYDVFDKTGGSLLPFNPPW